MKREEALVKLKKLAGQNLHLLAQEYQVTVCVPNGNVNKGWAGHVCERYLGIPINSSQSPNFGSWELKSIPLKQECILDPERGFSKLTGSMGVYIQPRTKGPGHGSVSRAFYARKLFLAKFIYLNGAVQVSNFI